MNSNVMPTGMTLVHHPQGTCRAETYLVNIYVPNKVAFTSVRVTKGTLPAHDVLIGMDVIGRGDFAVTNYQGKTVFTYRTPSDGMLDFTGQAPRRPPLPKALSVGRNDPCPCGSGKKFKKCCAGKTQATP
jgi:hypothetical protein